jgi:hypothetical protein
VTAAAKSLLPILSRLHALQSPSRIAPGGARVVASFSDPNPLAALLRELNETILSRALTFESSDGALLTVEVSGRRVLRLLAANGLPDADACLAAATLEDAHRDELCQLFQALAAPRLELRVTSQMLERSGDGISVGLPVAFLADLLQVDLNPAVGASAPPPPPVAARPAPSLALPPDPKPDPAAEVVAERRPPRTVRAVVAIPEPANTVHPPADPAPPVGTALQGFARGLGPVLMAWLLTGGPDDGACDGADEMVSHLRGFLEDEAAAILGQLDRVAEQRGGPACLVLGATLTGGNGILCARLDAGLLLALVDGDATGPVLAGWRAALA